MPFACFTSPVLIDLDLICITGASVKSENSIGRFGSGIKYAFAQLLRTGHEITIYRGLEEHKVRKVPTTLRGKEFDVIHVGDRSMNIATSMGPDWIEWMSLRELYSNMLDEGGEFFTALDRKNLPQPKEDTTLIVVEGIPFHNQCVQVDGVFLKGEADLFKGAHCEAFNKPSNWVFYRGIRAMKLQRPAMFTYNVLRGLDLTEDRTIKHEWMAKSIMGDEFKRFAPKEAAVKALCSRDSGYLEETFNWAGSSTTPSPQFMEALRENFRRKVMSDTGLKAAYSLLKPEETRRRFNLDDRAETRVKNVLSFLELKFNVELSKDDIEFVDSLGEGILGTVRDGKIFVAKEAVERGFQDLAITILEEWLHKTKGFSDGSREMQDYLFAQLINVSLVGTRWDR